jgi:hypothetical protein
MDRRDLLEFVGGAGVSTLVGCAMTLTVAVAVQVSP